MFSCLFSSCASFLLPGVLFLAFLHFTLSSSSYSSLVAVFYLFFLLGLVCQLMYDRWSFETEEEKKLFLWHWANLEYACATDLSFVSLKYWDQDDPFVLSGDHCLVPHGFMTILEGMAEGIFFSFLLFFFSFCLLLFLLRYNSSCLSLFLIFLSLFSFPFSISRFVFPFFFFLFFCFSPLLFRFGRSPEPCR